MKNDITLMADRIAQSFDDQYASTPAPVSTKTGAEILSGVQRLMDIAGYRPSPFNTLLLPASMPKMLSKDDSWFCSRYTGVPYHIHRMTRRRQVRFPRSKRRRIQKKWRKSPKNWANEPDPNAYLMNTRAMLLGV